MQDAPKAVWSIPYISFPSLKRNFIVYRSSKVSSCPDCIFEIHQLWQLGFSRVYSNSCCSWSFKPEIIKIGQSSHKMFSNKYTEFSRVYNNSRCLYKKSLESYWMHHILHLYILLLFYQAQLFDLFLSILFLQILPSVEKILPLIGQLVWLTC